MGNGKEFLLDAETTRRVRMLAMDLRTRRRSGLQVTQSVTDAGHAGQGHVQALPDIEDLHIWTADSVRADRLDFRPRHRLTVLVVQPRPLLAPVRLPRLDDYAGCRSWVDLPLEPRWGAPVFDDAELEAVTDRVRTSVG